MEELTREQKIFLFGFMCSGEGFNGEYINEKSIKRESYEEYIWRNIKHFYEAYKDRIK